MSEVIKNGVATNEERETYKLHVEPTAFEADSSNKYISSIDFCKLANEYFRAAFADYVGCTFDLNSGFPMLSLYFDHAKTVEGAVYACERLASKSSGNSLLDKTRGRDLQLKEGDRYHISDDGIDIIKPLLLPRYYNQGKPNWKQLLADVSENRTNMYAPQAAQSMTKIIGIDPAAICSIIYGSSETDESGDKCRIDYGVAVLADLTIKHGFIPGAQNANYALSITRAFSDHIMKTYEKFGISALSGSQIIR